MLIPAVLKKSEIIEASQKLYYTTDYLYYVGYPDNSAIDIIDNPGENYFQFASVDSDNNLIGYLAYSIDWRTLSAHRFGLISFDKGNPILIRDLSNELNKLLHEYKLHRLEWRVVSDNPIKKSYDHFCKKYGGISYELHDVIKDCYGNYHNEHIYEIINKEISYV